jgi:hypothetical protein
MTFEQNGYAAGGKFYDQIDQSGQIGGNVNDHAFTYSFTEGAYAGSGVFVMSPDGSTISGSYQVTTYPAGTDPSQLAATWTGVRGIGIMPTPAPATPAPAPVAPPDDQIDYGGCGGCGKADDGGFVAPK